jgi:serine/threonine-protein kinase
MPQVGKVLAGAYRVRAVLGAGAATIVLDAEHLANGARVAIKVFDPTELAKQPGGLRGFLREAGVLTQVAGEHTLRVLSFGRLETGAPYLVMEFVLGTDFRRALSESGPIWATEAAAFGAQACDSLAQAHGLGLVHRQLRPGNLLLVETEDGRRIVKVANYLVGEIVDGPSASGDADASTLEYAAPEVLVGGTVDARADVWSMGVILYELVCGVRPFTSKQVGEMVVQKKKKTQPPLMKSPLGEMVPEDYERIVFRCLEADPLRRYADAHELLLDLQDLSGPDEVTRVARQNEAPPPSLPPRPAFQAANDLVDLARDSQPPDSAAATVVQNQLTQVRMGQAPQQPMQLPSFVLEELPSNRGRNAILAGAAVVMLILLPLIYLRMRAESAPPPLEPLPAVAPAPEPPPKPEDVTKRLAHEAPSPSARASAAPMQQRFFQVPSAYTSR